MKNINIENEIKDLQLSKNTIDILHNNNIYKIKDLWLLSRKDLKNLSINNGQIKEIIIKLQLIGIDLNKKKYF